jgi:hypothetical protein
MPTTTISLVALIGMLAHSVPKKLLLLLAKADLIAILLVDERTTRKMIPSPVEAGIKAVSIAAQS